MLKGTCMAGACMVGGMCAGGMHGRGACVAGDMHGWKDSHCSG